MLAHRSYPAERESATIGVDEFGTMIPRAVLHDESGRVVTPPRIVGARGPERSVNHEEIRAAAGGKIAGRFLNGRHRNPVSRVRA